MLSGNRKTIGGNVVGKQPLLPSPSLFLLKFPPLDILMLLCTYKKQERSSKINLIS